MEIGEGKREKQWGWSDIDGIVMIVSYYFVEFVCYSDKDCNVLA